MADVAGDARGAAIQPMRGADSLPATGERRLTGGLLLGLGGLAALGALATNILLPSLPGIGKSLSVATPELGVALSAFFLAFAIGQLFVGPLSDRVGRRPLVLGGLVVFVAGSLLCAVAGDLGTLVAGRVVQALGACAASVLSRAIARDLFEGEALARVLGLTMVAMAAAPGFSPLLGGALDHVFGWRSAFVVVGAVGLLLAVFYAMRIGESHPPARRMAVDPISILRAYGGLVADRRFVMPALAVALLMGGLFAMFAASPAILMDGLGLSAIQLGLFFAATVFIVFAAGLIGPRFTKRLGARAVACAGLIVALVGGAALLAVAAAGAVTLAAYATAISVFLFGMGLANPIGSAIALSPFGRQAGLASALLGFLQLASAALGATLASVGSDPLLALGLVQAGFGATGLLVYLGLPAPLRAPAA